MSVFQPEIPAEALAREQKRQVQTQINDAVGVERERQDEKFGEQNHTPEKWLMIFIEELGESAQARLQGDRVQMIKELVEATAVMHAWIESELRQNGPAIEVSKQGFKTLWELGRV